MPHSRGSALVWQRWRGLQLRSFTKLTAVRLEYPWRGLAITEAGAP